MVRACQETRRRACFLATAAALVGAPAFAHDLAPVGLEGLWTRWSLDPVDGTRSFICRLPSWVTLIGLLQGGRPVLGLIDAPCLGERYIGFGSHGRLSLADGRTQPLSVSK